MMSHHSTNGQNQSPLEVQARSTCEESPTKSFFFSKTDWDAIRADMSEFSDEYFCSCEELPVVGKWTVFKARLAQLVDKYVPSKTPSTRYQVPWLTNVMERL